MKKIILAVGILICFISASSAFAASGPNQLPTKITYAQEWLNLNIFTFETTSKIETLDRYAAERVSNIETVYTAKNFDQIGEYASKYADLKSKEFSLIDNKKVTGNLLETVKTTTIEEQKKLSVVRDGLQDNNLKQSITKVQEDIVNKSKNVITNVENKDSASKFVDGVVTVWEDPQGTKGEATYANGTTAGEATHTYAAGTTAGGINGVVVDGGQAKVVEGSNGEVKIIYAPGTGANSVTQDNGKKVWTVQGSNGTTTQSSSSASNVVQGGTTGTGTTVIEGSNSNTASGTTGGQSTSNTGGGQVTTGGSQGQGGTTVVGQ
ncbi:MAG: hypothetical protein NTZ65_04620 [Candidatus Berkelbacteria bacterium]|nr:hypothetical protein [Candidatus Berkelbacteria bacterium]